MKIDRDFDENEYVKEISMNEFRNSGMLWWINSLLHNYGMCICIEDNRMYPAITKFRGFDEKNNDIGYRRLAVYMQDNIDDILKDLEEEQK